MGAAASPEDPVSTARSPGCDASWPWGARAVTGFLGTAVPDAASRPRGARSPSAAVTASRGRAGVLPACGVMSRNVAMVATPARPSPRVVHPHDEADPCLWQPGEEPHLPQWAWPGQAPRPDPLDRGQELCLVAGAGSVCSEMCALRSNEGASTHSGPPSRRGGTQISLPEPRHERCSRSPTALLTASIRRRPSGSRRRWPSRITERADLLRPYLVRPQDQPIFRTQSLHGNTLGRS